MKEFCLNCTDSIQGHCHQFYLAMETENDEILQITTEASCYIPSRKLRYPATVEQNTFEKKKVKPIPFTKEMPSNLQLIWTSSQG